MIKLRRSICLGLCVLLIFSQCINTFAGTPSQGGGSGSTGTVTNGTGNATPVGDHGGVRITVTNMVQAGAANAQPIDFGANYTEAIEQYDKLSYVLKCKVWQPGMYGLFVCSLK